MTDTDTDENVVLFEILNNHIAIVTLNRPRARNAINGAVTRALEAAVIKVESTRGIRAAILTSSYDPVFCAGADLVEISSGRGLDMSTDRGGFAGFVQAERSKPWIAAVEGAALAGGCEIVLACDMIVASEIARFGLPEVKRGLYAGAAGVYRLPRRLPRNIALELIATGDPLDAQRAYALGLANRLTPPGGVLPAAIEMAVAIAANAPISVEHSLRVARLAQNHSEEELSVLSAEARDHVFSTRDAKEGPRAFVEKRIPVWMGE